MDAILDFANKNKAIVISDMGRCLPAEALAGEQQKHHWHLIPYETEGFGGRILGANSVAEAPDVTLPLGVTGWHAVYVGLWNPHYGYDGDFRAKLKLTDDPCFQPIHDAEPPLEWPGRVEFLEAFFKYADLTRQDLVIRSQAKGSRIYPFHAHIGYVKLVPLSAEEVEVIQAGRKRSDTRKMYSFKDGNGLFYLGPTTREDLLEEVEQYRYSDFKAVLYTASSGDVTSHPSKFGLPWLAKVHETAIPASRVTLRDSVHTLLDKGIVPLQVLGEHVRDMGVEFHASFRMAILGEIAPSVVWNAGHGLVREHPELRMVHMDGTPMEKASYAYPEVRQFMLSLIREVIETYEVDGVNLGFIRGPHFAGYEDIVVRDFEKQYGIDPRTIDENDIRAQRHRASYVTTLVREARALTDEVGRKKGRKIELSAEGYMGQAEFNLFFGLDVMTWTNEGLMDNMFLAEPFTPELVDACRANSCRLVMGMGPGPDPAKVTMEMASAALRGLDVPVDGFSGDWGGIAQAKPELWELLRQVGNREQLQRMAETPVKMKATPLKTVEGFDVCHTTNRGANERGYWPPEMLPFYSCG